MRARRPDRGLAALLAVAALAAVAWSLVTPAFQGPDEAAHVAAVQRLVEEGRLVARPGEGQQLSAEVRTAAREAGLGPLVGNLAARPAFTDLDRRRWREADRALGADAALPQPGEEGLPVYGANRNPPLYALYMAVPYLAGESGSIFARLQLMRWWNVPLLLAAVVATWLLAAELVPGASWPRVLAAGVVALQPQLGFLAGTVNPDVLLAALGAGFLLAAVRVVRRGASPARVAALAALTAAAALTHTRGSLLFAGAVLALALAWPAARRRLVLVGGLAALAIAGVAAWLAAEEAGVSLLGATGGDAVGNAFSPRQFLSYLWQFYLPALPFMDPTIGPDYGVREAWVVTFWGTFGSLEVRFPGWVYTLCEVAALLLVAAAGAAVAARRVTVPWRAAAVVGGTALAYVLALHVGAYRTLLVDQTDPVLVGRHLLPLLPALAVAIAVAARGAPRRAGPPLAAGVLAALVVLEVGGLGMTLARFTT